MKTYTFIEALNSGKRFKPLSFTHWIELKDGYLFGDNNYIKSKVFYNSQFELEEKEITIAESKFDEIWARHISCHEGMTNDSYRESFKKELGF